jgi:hypothetical protein
MKKAMLFVLIGMSAAIGSAQPQPKTTGPRDAHLGVAVIAVPAAVYNQLPGTLAKGQGVLVIEVEKESPASKAGLKVDDILLSYGGQKIESPGQFVKMVRGDKPGKQVDLSYLRGGKSMSAKATLGEFTPPLFPDRKRSFRFLPDDELRRMFQDSEAKNNPNMWQSFDELRLTRQDDTHWRAVIDYRNKDGKKEEKTFNGTREEIRKSIIAEKDLPANERMHLLRALNMHDPVFEFHFPPASFRDQP